MKKLVIAGLLAAPALASAQTLSNLEQLLQSIGGLVRIATPIVIAIGLLVFLWGLVRFIFAGAEAKEEGKTLMIWGIVALFVMVSVWGLVRFIGRSLNIDQGGTIETPRVSF
jgi:hypothetical protein